MSQGWLKPAFLKIALFWFAMLYASPIDHLYDFYDCLQDCASSSVITCYQNYMCLYCLLVTKIIALH